jgi:hypothetical protein
MAYSSVQRVEYADLFDCWSIARVSPAMGQVLSRICSLSELLAFPSY